MRLLSIAVLVCVLSPSVMNAELAFQQARAAAPSQPNPVQHDGSGGQSVKVSQLPPLSISKDWTDRSYWVFALFLAVIGGFQAFLLWGNLRAIERQAIQMERQTGILQQSVALAEKSAEAARQNIDLFINRERAHLRIELLPLQWPLQPGVPSIHYKIVLHGATEAYVKASCARAELTDSPEPKEDTHWSPPMNIPQVITPEQRIAEGRIAGVHPKMGLEAPEIAAIEAGTGFIHVRGFVQYNDVFGTERWTRFRRVWDIPRLSKLDSTRTGHWSKRGGAKDNSET